MQITKVGMIAAATLFAGWGTAVADCDCGRTDPENPCYGNTASRQVGPATVTFSFNADGEDCACGRFVNGEVWVAPKTESGKTVSAVTITAIAPAGQNNGAHSNLSNRGTSQGLLPRWGNYNIEDNIMTQLPYAAKPGEVILKAVERLPSSSCGTNATKAKSCADAYDALTVLDAVPENCGATVFRPPYAGTDKPLRTTDRIRWDRLPRIPLVSANSSRSSFASIIGRWSVPTCDIVREGGQEIYRGFTAMGTVSNDYAADVAFTYLKDLISTFGTEPDSVKAAAVYALLQPGFDNYAVFKLGFKFGSGAGQHLGKKPQIVFAGALYDDPDIAADIRPMAARDLEGWFQEDEQIKYVEGVSTTPVWGNGTDYNYYWNGLCSWYKGGADNKRTNGDPYRYIDGPGGGPLDISYQWCCSSGPFTMYSFAQHLMPWMRYVNNDPEIVAYADRVFNGRGIDNFGGGWWGAPDPCAGPDPRECRECAPYKGDNHGCLYYGVTWGPDPAKPGDCIRHTPATYAPVDYRDVEDDNCLKFRGDSTGIGCTHYGETWGRDSVTGEWITVGTDPARQGRFPSLHATANPPTSWNRMSSLVTSMWLRLRDCADPDSPTYPCTGLGAEAPGTGLLDLLQPAGEGRSAGIRVFPNPSTGSVFISGKADIFHVYDHAGRLVRKVGNHTAHLPQGVYVICTPDHAAAVRLMVVR